MWTRNVQIYREHCSPPAYWRHLSQCMEDSQCLLWYFDLIQCRLEQGLCFELEPPSSLPLPHTILPFSVREIIVGYGQVPLFRQEDKVSNRFWDLTWTKLFENKGKIPVLLKKDLYLPDNLHTLWKGWEKSYHQKSGLDVYLNEKFFNLPIPITDRYTDRHRWVRWLWLVIIGSQKNMYKEQRSIEGLDFGVITGAPILN